MNKEYIHGFYVNFEEADRDGIYYLREDLQYREAKTLFDAARVNGSAFFEDDYDRDWTITYNATDGTYTLVRRPGEE